MSGWQCNGQAGQLRDYMKLGPPCESSAGRPEFVLCRPECGRRHAGRDADSSVGAPQVYLNSAPDLSCNR